MSHLSKVFNKVPVKVQKRSGFDMSHENLFSAKIGTLIPASVEEVMPGDVVSVGSALAVELPPLATNFKGRVDARLEAFFVPNRILWAGWQDYICQDAEHKPIVPSFSVASEIPKVRLTSEIAGAGSLADYLGVKTFSGTTIAGDVNALPFLAYQKIVDDWYRDSNIQQPFFVDGVADVNMLASNGDNTIRASMAPYLRNSGMMNVGTIQPYTWPGSVLGYNGRDLRSLAQRNFAKDYVTTMTTKPQGGDGSSLSFSVEIPDITDLTGNTTLGNGSFSIRSLRTANALQKWLERNNIAGTRYYDQILAHYGVLPSDAAFQRAVLLGSMTTPVIVNSVAQQAQGTNSQTKNPYANSTGAMFGRGNAFGKDRLIDNFEVKEHGYIFIMFSLVPHAYYSTGTRRYLMARDNSGDWAFPEFAGIGDQEVYKYELNSGSLVFPPDAGPDILGYSQRYAEYKYHDDEIHGLLQDGQSLNSFVLSRGFDSSVALSTSLLEIPTNFMDSVMVTTAGVSGFNAVVDAYFDAKYLRPLPEYSLPTLCEGENDGKKVYVPKGGTRL